MNSSRPNSPSPFSLGYWMHAEWAPHKATWLAWPHEKTDWPGKFAPIPWVYGDVVRRLSQAERVCILVNDSAAERAARNVLKPCGANLKAVDFFRVPTNRGWIRDFGPIFVKNGQLAFQCLGQVQELAKRRRRQRQARGEIEVEGVEARPPRTPRGP